MPLLATALKACVAALENIDTNAAPETTVPPPFAPAVASKLSPVWKELLETDHQNHGRAQSPLPSRAPCPVGTAGGV